MAGRIRAAACAAGLHPSYAEGRDESGTELKTEHQPPTFGLEREQCNGEEVVVLRLLGEHDLASAEELRRRLFVQTRQRERVAVDLTETDFIDSCVLSNLIRADRALQEAGAVWCSSTVRPRPSAG